VNEFLARHGTEFLVFAFILLTLAALLAPCLLFLHHWRKVREAEIEAGVARAELQAALKHDMLNRGMSANEIQVVLAAGTHANTSPPSGPAAPSPGPSPQAEAAKEESGGNCWEAFAKKWEEFGKQWGDWRGKHGWRRKCRNC
jgi:hypothetical protein